MFCEYSFSNVIETFAQYLCDVIADKIMDRSIRIKIQYAAKPLLAQ